MAVGVFQNVHLHRGFLDRVEGESARLKVIFCEQNEICIAGFTLGCASYFTEGPMRIGAVSFDMRRGTSDISWMHQRQTWMWVTEGKSWSSIGQKMETGHSWTGPE